MTHFTLGTPVRYMVRSKDGEGFVEVERDQWPQEIQDKHYYEKEGVHSMQKTGFVDVLRRTPGVLWQLLRKW